MENALLIWREERMADPSPQLLCFQREALLRMRSFVAPTIGGIEGFPSFLLKIQFRSIMIDDRGLQCNAMQNVVRLLKRLGNSEQHNYFCALEVLDFFFSAGRPALQKSTLKVLTLSNA